MSLSKRNFTVEKRPGNVRQKARRNGHDYMHILKKKREKCTFFDPIYVVVGLCPNCARQGQSFPNISKRNLQSVEKVV
jgi:hypothetical protein